MLVTQYDFAVFLKERCDILGVAEEAGGVAVVVLDDVLKETGAALGRKGVTVRWMSMSDWMRSVWLCSELYSWYSW